ncbi:serine/threonine dehydratase [Aliidiomarina iranensis]|uniref:Serine/threonine dehydratase n=1 Tax=Aliidiomarina iranensis TaxID=1434071 RepID=A0A432W2K8_9GAMM|nr:threonine/serine dehydratase [Aliidiomarina iranensis]RUO23346.1 serine/threonine dehydratase [Aliidiomarina iranensis]
MTGWQHIAGQDDLNLDLIHRAEKLIAPYIMNTPVLRSPELDNSSGARLFFKCENLQHTGAFKFRGAIHALLNLTAAQRKAGVYTVSSGNHGAALAAAGRILNISVQVAVPTNAPSVKKQNIAQNGADIIEIEPGMAAREAFVAANQQQSERIFIPPYNHPLIMAGQGTAALELVKAVPELQVLMSPLGGGGLLSGTAMVGHSQNMAVFGVEPELANDAWLSLQAGSIQSARPPISICDGLLTNLGDHTFPIIQNYVDAVLLVSEDEVIVAMQQLWQALKVIVEPSAATVFAAVCKYPEHFSGKAVGLILSGGNLDVACLPWPVTRLEKAK